MPTCISPVAVAAAERVVDDDLHRLIRTPWSLRVRSTDLLIRPTHPHDLRGIAQLHARSSARSLLDRYRAGGRPPSIVTLDRLLREPSGVVAATADGAVIAFGVVTRDVNHGSQSAQLGMLVEDVWQRLGIGTELVTHLAGVAQVAGYRELISYPATALDAVRNLMSDLGRTRLVRDVDLHLHTQLPEEATIGLGPVRQRLVG